MNTASVTHMGSFHFILVDTFQRKMSFVCRLAERKAETFHSRGTSDLQTSLDQIWRPARIGKQLRGRHARQTPLMSVSTTSTKGREREEKKN